MNSQIIDEKSLIKKYQNEIRCLKEELDQLKRGIVTLPQLKDVGEDDIVLLKQKVSLFCVRFLPFRRPSILVIIVIALNFFAKISYQICNLSACSTYGESSLLHQFVHTALFLSHS